MKVTVDYFTLGPCTYIKQRSVHVDRWRAGAVLVRVIGEHGGHSLHHAVKVPGAGAVSNAGLALGTCRPRDHHLRQSVTVRQVHLAGPTVHWSTIHTHTDVTI